MAAASTSGASGKRPAVADDRLSALPDVLLHTIMSFMTAREAVQTCVLSRRWENLWCSMLCLDIEQPEFTFDSHCCARFEEFVSNLLMFHSAVSLDRFRLKLSHYHYHNIKLFNRWIRRGIQRCPLVLELLLDYMCSGLAPLRYSSSRLKRLYLSGINLDNTFTQQLRSNCPVLEDLELRHCCLEEPEISSCTLKKLTIVSCTSRNGASIAAPALAYLQLARIAFCIETGFVLNEMPSLVEATIDVLLHSPENIAQTIPHMILGSLSNVTKLELSGLEITVMLEDGSENFPVFHNLRTLLLVLCDLSCNFKILGCILNNAPALEKLTLQYCKLPEVSTKRVVVTSCQDILTFDCPNFKWTEIIYKEEDGDKLLVLLLGVWKNLQKTTIVLHRD